ncbi:Folliculin [Brachionus plicatilis]|uniref:Folliculin n=1 Tax=Brachionus plicatilis TaxID=10195 RepID=A0A3M7RH11_BRAPC|nr:Folliculin [Brachionus plicatilis]
MNAIIALCHFCDHHGPTTLFCTQAFKYSDYQSMNANKLNERIGILLESAPPGAHSPDLSDQENKIMGANVSPSQSEAAQPSSNCKACQAFDKNFHHYISYDNSTNFPNSPNQICYLSQSSPNVSEVFALVRKACLRTLHCEVFEDPIFFDDDKNGSVIGYEFIIKDIEGRGWQRSYSLIIIMRDRIYLQHLWSFLSKQMSIIATNLKEQAEKKFQKDLFERGLSPTGNPAQILSFKKTSKQVRGLVELTDDPLIFAKLHMWFTWMLRMCSCQISEEFMHGPLSEDSQIKYMVDDKPIDQKFK